jgi:deferrochelatase/peroxidase EfeB
MDETIWTTQGWAAFNDALSELEHEVGPLGIPRDLLRPVIPDNDFRHGEDDPLGLYCPIGSHIRRANPRDSFRPGHEITLQINNRHRLLRRGRTYSSAFDTPQDAGLIDAGWVRRDTETVPPVEKEEGTFFMCFNANIERQFEFVQQTWINADGFHGGRHGPDPLITPKQKGDTFIIPGSEESLALDMCPMSRAEGEGVAQPAPVDFTRTVAGGYFFMPSKQALAYLSQL